MPLTPISLGTQSNPARYGPDGAAHLVNCYVENAGQEGKIQWPIYASDGFVSWATVGSGTIRAALNLDDITLYVVSGTAVYAVNSSGTATACTGSISGSGYVSMVRNRLSPNPEIGIVTSDGHFYILSTATNTVASQALPGGAPAPISIAVLDGYFVVFCVNGSFYISGIDNGTVYDGLLFADAEAYPDAGSVAATRGRDLVLLGTRSIEFWNDTGNGDFPFSRSGVTAIGVYAPQSVCEVLVASGGSVSMATGTLQDSLAFVGCDVNGFYAGVMLLEGYSGFKISTAAVDRAIRGEPSAANIRGFTWSNGGHIFYCVTGTTFTWVYDISTGFWHERKSDGASLAFWRIADAVRFSGRTLVADYTLPKLYHQRHDLYDEDGTDFTMTVQPPAVHAWPDRLRFFSIHLDVIPGVGLASGADADVNPTISLTHSNDNGNTWSPVRIRALGQSGQNRVRVKINRLGESLEDGKVFRYTMAARVVRALTGAAVDTKVLRD